MLIANEVLREENREELDVTFFLHQYKKETEKKEYEEIYLPLAIYSKMVSVFC